MTAARIAKQLRRRGRNTAIDGEDEERGKRRGERRRRHYDESDDRREWRMDRMDGEVR